VVGLDEMGAVALKRGFDGRCSDLMECRLGPLGLRVRMFLGVKNV